MRNPFKSDLPTAANGQITYAPVPENVGPDPNDAVHANVVFLDDATYPDQYWSGTQDAGNLGDKTNPQVESTFSQGDESVEIINTPGPVQPYTFLPHDLATPVDIGSIPGTDYLIIHKGPVTGNILDAYQEGNIATIGAQAPGNYGPVTGRTDADYATLVAYAQFQQLLTDYSPDVANAQQIAAI